MKIIRELLFELPGICLPVLQLQGVECLNQASVFRFECAVDDTMAITAWLGQRATIKALLQTGEQLQKLGVITQVRKYWCERSHTWQVRVVLKSPLALLRLYRQPRVFLNENKLTVIKHVLLNSAVFQADQCYFHLHRRYQRIPMILQFFEESDYDFICRLCAECGLFFWENAGKIHFCDQGLLCPEQSLQLIVHRNDGYLFRFWVNQQGDCQRYFGQSYLFSLQPGHRVVIDDQSYLVRSVKHIWQRSCALSDTAIPYWNRCQFALPNSAFLFVRKPLLQIPICFQAHIESPHPYALLNASGQYKLKYYFDSSEHAVGQHSQFISRVQYHPGMHFPLYHGVEVWVTCVNGDPYRSVILAVVSNSEQRSQVTQDNPNDYVIKTQSQLHWVMNDRQCVSHLKTPTTHWRFDQAKQAIVARVDQGDFKTRSAQETQLTHGQQCQVLAGRDWVAQARQSLQLLQSRGNLHWQSASDMQWQSGESILAKANTIRWHGLNQLSLEATNFENLSKQQQLWQADKELRIDGQYIQLRANQTLEITCGKTAIRLTPNAIELFAPTIQLFADSGIVRSNKMQFEDQGLQIFHLVKRHLIEDILLLSVFKETQHLSIRDCFWDASKARIGDTVFAKGLVSHLTTQTQGELWVFCHDQCIDRQKFSISDVRQVAESGNTLVKIPWLVKETQSSQRYAYHECVQYYFEIHIDAVKNEQPSNALQIETDVLVQVSYQTIELAPDYNTVMWLTPNQQSQLRLLNQGQATIQQVQLGKSQLSFSVKVSDTLYQQQTVYSAQQKQPWSDVTVRLPANLKTQSVAVQSVFPPVILHLDDKPDAALLPPKWLDEHTLEQLASSCQGSKKNVTIFIHGFDVKPGQFSRYVSAVEQDSWCSDGLSVRFSNVDSTIYHEKSDVQKRFPLIKTDRQFMQRHAINGTGSHAWLLAIEYFLNKACGLTQQGYDYHQRMIGVCWPASAFALDYISITRRIRAVGKKVYYLFRQLLLQGFEVNVIAHSLGNGVLLQALNALGQDKICSATLNHCFLWEAAVPNTVFSVDPEDFSNVAKLRLRMESDHWYVPYAARAAKKFVVLYSQNDNVLGPIPRPQPAGVSQFYINAQKPIFSELLPAVLLTYFGLGSIYDVAMTLSIPLVDAISLHPADRFYAAWYARYHPIVDKQQRLYPSTLSERVAQIGPEAIANIRARLNARYQKNKTLIHQYIQAATKHQSEWTSLLANSILVIIDRSSVIDWIMRAPGMLCHNRLINDHDDPMCKYYWDAATEKEQAYLVLLDSLFENNQLNYAKALGYQGVDTTHPTVQQLMCNEQLTQVDQTDCLFQHSGMKTPNKRLFKAIYQQAIWQANPTFHFGRYRY